MRSTTARTKEALVPILFRYFMAASLMSQEFDKHLTRDPKDSALHGGDPMAFLVSKAGLKMCLWYGMLYVVIEGWRDAKLSDAEVDRLLASPNTELLRLFRNGMFHFQTDYWLPKKFSGFFEPKNKTVEWVRSLTTELRRSLLAEMKKSAQNRNCRNIAIALIDPPSTATFRQRQLRVPFFGGARHRHGTSSLFCCFLPVVTNPEQRTIGDFAPY